MHQLANIKNACIRLFGKNLFCTISDIYGNHLYFFKLMIHFSKVFLCKSQKKAMDQNLFLELVVNTTFPVSIQRR